MYLSRPEINVSSYSLYRFCWCDRICRHIDCSPGCPHAGYVQHYGSHILVTKPCQTYLWLFQRAWIWSHWHYQNMSERMPSCIWEVGAISLECTLISFWHKWGKWISTCLRMSWLCLKWAEAVWTSKFWEQWHLVDHNTSWLLQECFNSTLAEALRIRYSSGGCYKSMKLLLLLFKFFSIAVAFWGTITRGVCFWWAR